jgi:hypothetical protein
MYWNKFLIKLIFGTFTLYHCDSTVTILYIFYFSLLPQKLTDVLMRFSELDEAMKEFTGHKKEI